MYLCGVLAEGAEGAAEVLEVVDGVVDEVVDVVVGLLRQGLHSILKMH